MRKIQHLAFILIAVIFMLSCSSVKNFNVFSVDQDVALGKQVQQQIASDPAQFPLLAERGNEEVYRYIRKLTDQILNTGRVKNRDKFAWEVAIIDDNETLNAFATPGGYIYVYTGLIKFLDSEDQLAGVMGHEIAHAANRHSTRQLTKVYGLQVLASIVTGNTEPGMMEQVALSLATLKFGRDHETEADSESVNYLCHSGLNATGAAGFFQKMAGQPQQPQFLSTHPNPGNRVQNINKRAQQMQCPRGSRNQGEYNRIKSLLK